MSAYLQSVEEPTLNVNMALQLLSGGRMVVFIFLSLFSKFSQINMYTLTKLLLTWTGTVRDTENKVSGSLFWGASYSHSDALTSLQETYKGGGILGKPTYWN